MINSEVEFDKFAATCRGQCRAWLETVRTPDKPVGYFKWSRHAYHDWTLYASIDAFSIYKELNLLASLTDAEKQTWSKLFLDHYNPQVGVFICPQVYGDTFRGDPENINDIRLADSSAPVKKVFRILFELGATVPEVKNQGRLHLSSIDGMRDYLNAEKIRQEPYSFGSTIGNLFHQRTLWLDSQKIPYDNDDWLNALYNYTDQIKDPATGLVKSYEPETMDHDYLISEMNGLFKLSCPAYFAPGKAIPQGEKVIDTVLDILSHAENFGKSCDSYNAANMLIRLCIQENGYRRDDIHKAVMKDLVAFVKSRMKPDGAFSFNPDFCLTTCNSFSICDPLPESDLKGTSQQLSVLKLIGQFYGTK